ncbi:MAG: undecaprenyl-diphosphate phosphatase, partial [Clostridia bacterium]|nr:undecaprenyl-diphosphate phosphatase [Clostridia bacterium]
MSTFIEILKSIVFGIVEGITEWLPVSSTGHLIILDELLRLNVGDGTFNEHFMEMFNVVIQLGAILAVLVMFFYKLNPFAPSKSKAQKNATWYMWFKVLVASVPAAIVGLFVDKILEKSTGKDIDGWLYNSIVVAAALVIYGVLFIVIERLNKNKAPKIIEISDVSFKTAFLIGVFQMLAIIPGTSRSGSTILGSMLLGVSRTVAAEFSFFMAIPAMAGASLLKLVDFFGYVSESAVSIPL